MLRLTTLISCRPGWYALMLVVLLTGCGGKKGPPRQKIYYVTGTFTVDQQPYGPARLMLYPVDKSLPWVHVEVDQKGAFTCSTYSKSDGAPAGEYKVTVSDAPKDQPLPQVYRMEVTTDAIVKFEKKRNTKMTIDLNSKADEIAKDKEMEKQGFVKDKNGKYVRKR